jgi:hypothetical protein
LLGVTFRALSGNEFLGGGEFVHAAVARSARGFAEDGVNAGGERLGLVRMAGGALHFGDFGGMRELFDGGVAILAAKNRVGAGGMLGWVDGNAFSGAGLHSRFAMARQAFLVSGGRGRSHGGSHNQSQVNQSNPSRAHFNTLLVNSSAKIQVQSSQPQIGSSGMRTTSHK